MKKICFLHTNPDLVNSVRAMLPQIATKSNIECIQAPAHELLEDCARQAVKNGASVLVSRGIEATLLQTVTDFPVVEVIMTMPEFIDLIGDAKRLVGKKNPVLAVVGFAGSYSKLAPLQNLTDVRIKEYLVEDFDDYGLYRQKIQRYIDQAVEHGADCIIGGKVACDYASEHTIPNLFNGSSIDSLREAFHIADMIALAVEEEKKKIAEFKAVVDNSFGAVIMLDRNGKITLLNYIAEKLLEAPLSALEGKDLMDVITIPQDECDVSEIFRSGKNYHSVLFYHRRETLVANMAPVMVDGSIEGAIISIEELRKIEKNHSDIYKSLYANTFVASHIFEQQVAHSPAMTTVMRHAQVYAHYDTPILITGEIGSGKKALAQCIHNASVRRDGPFAALDCSTLSPDALDRMLYGISDYGNEFVGLLRIANDGTLYLENITTLDSYAQQKLTGVLSDNTYFDPNTGRHVALSSRMRLICASRQDISLLVAKGEFSPALYCALQTLTLHMPPLRERKDDIWDLANRYVSAFSSQHKKFVRLEENVLDVLRRFSWPGNVYQLNKYCERLVVMTESGSVDAGTAEQFLPIWGESSAYDSTPHTEYDRILNALKLHGGNRSEAANELGLSKTTLWRRMKQYGIQWQ